MRRRKINEELIATAESSPSGRDDDDDDDTVVSPASSRDTSTPQTSKRPSRLFADEDDIESIP
jgi:hypothetical protein